MKSWGGVLALLLPLSAFAQDVDFRVLRSGCAANGPDSGDWLELSAAWRPDGALEVDAWDTENDSYAVVDGSATMDVSKPGVIRLAYRGEQKKIDEGDPIVFCEDWVKLRFVVRGVARANYGVVVEGSGRARRIEVPTPVPAEAVAAIAEVHGPARREDFAALRARMDDAFVWSFGGDGDADQAIAHWRQSPDSMRELARVVSGSCGPLEGEDGVVQCPASGTEIGYRAGFKAFPEGWRMVWFVAGD